MTLLPWHSPYDWQWMFHFLGARTVQGIETFVGDSYCRSFALNDLRRTHHGDAG